MSVRMILLPLFVHVALMLSIWVLAVFGLAPRPAEDMPPRRDDLPLAILFYTLTILAFFTRKADLLFVILAWVFVGCRLLAAFPQALSRDALVERTVELVAAGVLLVMWVLFALAILFNI